MFGIIGIKKALDIQVAIEQKQDLITEVGAVSIEVRVSKMSNDVHLNISIEGAFYTIEDPRCVRTNNMFKIESEFDMNQIAWRIE